MGRFAERADAVVSRAVNTGKALSVWCINGKWKVTAVETALFDEGMAKHPEKLVGIYDDGCLQQWVDEDLEWMAARAQQETHERLERALTA